MPGGLLAPLLELNRNKVCGTELDLHFRGGDEVHVYCGLTRVLVARRTIQCRLLRQNKCPCHVFQSGMCQITHWPMANWHGWPGGRPR